MRVLCLSLFWRGSCGLGELGACAPRQRGSFSIIMALSHPENLMMAFSNIFLRNSRHEPIGARFFFRFGKVLKILGCCERTKEEVQM